MTPEADPNCAATTTPTDRIKARLLAHASTCYSKGMRLAGDYLVTVQEYAPMAMLLRGCGETWAEFKCASWRPYKTDFGVVAGWAYAILYVVAREETTES